jgi:hypothetical protein
MGNDGDLKRLEKQNYSVLSNSSVPLTQAQLTALTARPVRKMEVGWKKKPEEYEIALSRFSHGSTANGFLGGTHLLAQSCSQCSKCHTISNAILLVFGT